MRLDYSSLERALAKLERSLRYLHSDLARGDPELREQFRLSTIQAFSFTYELAVKMIRRQLSRIISNLGEAHRIDFAELMCAAADAGLISDPSAYLEYRELRSNTSQNYNAHAAEDTVAGMDQFIYDVRFLLEQLRKRNRETD